MRSVDVFSPMIPHGLYVNEYKMAFNDNYRRGKRNLFPLRNARFIDISICFLFCIKYYVHLNFRATNGPTFNNVMMIVYDEVLKLFFWIFFANEKNLIGISNYVIDFII